MRFVAISRIRRSPCDIDWDRDKRTHSECRRRLSREGLYDAYGSRQVLDDLRAKRRILGDHGVLPEFQSSPATLRSSTCVRPAGNWCRFDTVVKFTRSLGPLQINHRAAAFGTISFDVAPGVSLGKALGEVKKLSGRSCRIASRPASRELRQAFDLRSAASGCCW